MCVEKLLTFLSSMWNFFSSISNSIFFFIKSPIFLVINKTTICFSCLFSGKYLSTIFKFHFISSPTNFISLISFTICSFTDPKNIYFALFIASVLSTNEFIKIYRLMWLYTPLFNHKCFFSSDILGLSYLFLIKHSFIKSLQSSEISTEESYLGYDFIMQLVTPIIPCPYSFPGRNGNLP